MWGGSDNPALKVAAAQAAAAKINSLLTPSLQPPSSLASSPNSVSSSTSAIAPPSFAVPGAPQTDEAKVKAREIAAKINSILVAKTGEIEGVAAPPMSISEREMEGLKFGLHREGFAPQNQSKTMQLLIGMEIEHANGIGFDLATHLQGINRQNLIHIMTKCPGVLLVLQGRGTPLASTENLHFKLTGKDKRLLDTAKILADNLILTVRREYDVAQRNYALRHQPAFAASPLVVPPPSQSSRWGPPLVAGYPLPALPATLPTFAPPSMSSFSSASTTTTTASSSTSTDAPPEDLYDPLNDVADSSSSDDEDSKPSRSIDNNKAVSKDNAKPPRTKPRRTMHLGRFKLQRHYSVHQKQRCPLNLCLLLLLPLLVLVFLVLLRSHPRLLQNLHRVLLVLDFL